MMSYRMLSPVSGTQPSNLPSGRRFEDTKFFSVWLNYRSEDARANGLLNRHMIAGLGLMIAVSAGGWSGLVLLVRHLLK
jgi:hypothetical protein